MSESRAIPDEERPFIPEKTVPRESDDPMRAAESLEQQGGRDDEDDEATVADVPAGGAGADSGAVPAVQIDPDDEAAVPNRSSMNDVPGVGTRDADREPEDRG